MKNLAESGIIVRYSVDVGPRKIGQHPHGVPVVFLDNLDKDRLGHLLVCVAASGARQVISEKLTDAGFRENSDFSALYDPAKGSAPLPLADTLLLFQPPR